MPNINLRKKPLILAIESSCDETAVAITQGNQLRAQKTTTQHIHEQHGGVVPELAARTHHQNIIPTLHTTLQQAKVTLQNIDYIAVTQGPGLLGSLLVGTSFAQGIAKAHNTPIIGIHHTKAHLLANFITPPYPTYPFLGLIISGGHTQLVRVESAHAMTLLGSTLDDAVGEAFDKIAKMMGFPYPGGTHIDQHAQKGNPAKFTFPKTKAQNFDFSFSGIKTAFRYFIEKQQQQDPNFVTQHRNDLCASIQATLVDILVEKTAHAMQTLQLNNLALGGGVACNTALRSRFTDLAEKHAWNLFIPPAEHCTDNAAMIAIAGYFHIQAQLPITPITPLPRMPF